MDLTLLQPIAPATELKQALQDLDISHILTFADARFTAPTAAAWIERYFCCDPEEITARSAVLTDVCKLCTEESLEQAIASLAAIRIENEKLGRALSKVDEVLYAWRRLQAYVHCIDIFTEVFPVRAYTSPRTQALAAFFQALHEDSQLGACRAALEQMDQLLQLPDYVFLGVNVKEDGSPQELGILGDAVGAASVNALLCPRDHTAPSDSLGAEFVYNSNLYGFHFDEYIHRALEKQWKGTLGRANKLLLETPLPHLEEMLQLEEPLDFYLVGLRCMNCYTRRGYTLCRPEFHAGGGFFAKNMKYPELILHQDHVQGNDIMLHPSDAVIITGANHSGKTSYLKTLGQGYFLAQLGFFVPAESLSLTAVTGIYTLFSAGEDDSMDASRMGVEIRKLTNILNHAAASDLVLLNEPMTSTNPVEAVSICADLMQHFLKQGIPHLLVTHLYDIYFLLRARLGAEGGRHLKSLITESYYDEAAHGMVHHYRLREAEPEGNSYARETAAAFGITLSAMLPDAHRQAMAAEYCRAHHDNLVYEKEDSHGLSDLR